MRAQISGKLTVGSEAGWVRRAKRLQGSEYPADVYRLDPVAEQMFTNASPSQCASFNHSSLVCHWA